MGPSWGTSYTLSNYLILSKVSRLGERPPCNENIFPSTKAVKGRKSNTSVKNFHTFELPYFLTDSS